MKRASGAGSNKPGPPLKKAHQLKAWLVFLDESGLLMGPLVRRSWQPRGQTPVLVQRGRHLGKVSAIAALGVPPRRDGARLYFRLHPQAEIGTAQFVASIHQLHTCFLPAYAPELNPVEYTWSYLKMNPLANRPAFETAELAAMTRRHARALQRNEPLLRSFLRHSPLFCA